MENQAVEKKRFFTVSSEKSTFAWLSVILFFIIIALEACMVYGPIATKQIGRGDTKWFFEWTEFFQSESGLKVSSLIYLIHGGVLVMIYSMLKKCMSTEKHPMKKIWIALIALTGVLYAYYAFFPHMEITDYEVLKNMGLMVNIMNALIGLFMIIICWTFILLYSGRIKASGITILVSSGLVIPVMFLGTAFVISYQRDHETLLILFWTFFVVHIVFNLLIYIMFVCTMVGNKDKVQPLPPLPNQSNAAPLPPLPNQSNVAPVQTPVVNAQPTPPAQDTNNTEQPEKNNKKLFVIIGGAVVAVALIVIIWLVAGKSSDDVIEDNTVSSEYTDVYESAQDEAVASEETIAEESTMAGKYFVVTGTNVLIRKGPGKEYDKVVYDGAGEDGYSPAHAQKGEVVKCLQAEENNYAYVKTCNGYGWTEGWVSCDYLVATTVCPECHGVGQDPSYGEFDVDGPRCKTCKGKGHL